MRRVFAFLSAVLAGLVGNAIFEFAVHHPPATAAVEPHRGGPPAAAIAGLAPLPPPQVESAKPDPAAAVTMVPAAPAIAAIGKSLAAALPPALPAPPPIAGPGPGNGGLY